MYGFNALADARGVAIVYPDGLDHHWNDGRGATGQHWLDTVLADDVGFVSALIDHLIHTLRIDPRGVYATGISNGAIFSHRLGCDLSDRITAIAPVAGTIAEPLAPRCAPHAPVSVVEFHGTDDRFVPYGGGEILRQTERGKVLSVASTTALWARLNGCRARPQVVDLPTAPPDGTRVQRASYGPCAGGSEVILYTIEGGGHTWPGSPAQSLLFGPTSHQIDATETIWEFFDQHRKR
jgi:polyhydroxybutyrate depolymerase